MNLSPTAHTDVNEILSLLSSAVTEVLKDQLVGMYLHGSLANGGFDEHSDIDVSFLTKEALSDQSVEALQVKHTALSKINSPLATQMEVAYIPEIAFDHFDPSIRYPHLDRGDGEVLHKISPESDWSILCHILREKGIIIFGPDPKSFIAIVSPDQLKHAVTEGMPIWFSPIIANPDEINKRGYQSFFVLSMCRMLYTLTHGEILSKPSAAEWGLKNLDQRWYPLIERALVGRQNPNLDADPEDIKQTIEMMKYTLSLIKPTPYAEVNEVLNLLLTNAKAILRDQFVGMYLYGSLSSGDFDLETSDIDFLFVTESVLSEDVISQLENMHKKTWATSLKRAGKLEGAYVSKELIRRHDLNGGPCPTVNEGKFYTAPLGSDWIIQRHVVREYGVIVEGADPKSLIDYVSPDEIRSAVKGILDEWWYPMFEDPLWLRDNHRGYHSYAILSMCRALHALEHGTIASKPVAAK